MSAGPDDVRAANARADAARARFRGALAFARSRTSPGRIRDDVIENAKARFSEVEHDIRTTARRHPVAISSAFTAILALIFRKPLSALAGKGWNEVKQLKQRIERERNL